MAIGTRPPILEFYEKLGKMNSYVSPEFLLWLEKVAPREGVGANQAWNAALTLCSPSESWLTELGELSKVYAVAHANLRVEAERGKVSEETQKHNDNALAELMKHGQRRVQPLKEIR